MIYIDGLSKEYKSTSGESFSCLKDISLEVKEGEAILLQGENGSGKSTLLSIIGGIIRPSSGEIRVCGELIAKLPDHFSSNLRREKIGFIFQSFNLIDELTAVENVLLPLIPGSDLEDEMYDKANQALSLVSLTKKKNELTKNLSGGEKQRVAIARAVVNRPKIILADEPTSQIDSYAKKAFINYLKEFKERGITLVVSTHDSQLASWEGFDKTFTLRTGRLH